LDGRLARALQLDFRESDTEATLLAPIEQDRCDRLASTRQGAASLAYGDDWKIAIARSRLMALVLSGPPKKGSYTTLA
jgi:hypothetical protein